MEKDNIGGEKAIIEERRKKLEQLRDKGDAYVTHSNLKIMQRIFMKNMEHFLKKSLLIKILKISL